MAIPEDIRPQRRSLKEVLPPRREMRPTPVRAEPTPAVSRRGSWRPTILIGILLLIVLGILAVIIGNAFAQATIIITPKTATYAFDNTDITYGPLQVMTLQPVTDSRIVAATGSKKVDQTAKGTIIVYNAYNSTAQKFVSGTRFQSKAGKIYRSTTAITVPGTTTKGGTTTPGSVEVAVVADAPGVDYNTDLTSFTIPGFKDDPRASKFYAQSKTAMTGGFSGTIPSVSDEELARVHHDLEETLTSRALQEARAQIPDNYIVYADGTFLTFEDKVEAVTGSSTSAKISTIATLKAILFDRAALTEKLGSTQATSLSKIPFTLPDLGNLTITLANKDTLNLTNDKTVAIVVNGTTTAVANLDTTALNQALAGKPVKDAQATFGQFPAIESAQIKLTPFWMGNFPQNKAKLSLKILTP